jgi:hypothetical protein
MSFDGPSGGNRGAVSLFQSAYAAIRYPLPDPAGPVRNNASLSDSALIEPNRRQLSDLQPDVQHGRTVWPATGNGS